MASTVRRFLSRKVQVPPPPTVDWLLLHRQYPKPSPPCSDSLSVLYRLYQTFVLDDTRSLRNEIEFFWNKSTWAVSAIPDPKDLDPVRYAILAVITEWLCQAFNNLIMRGLPRDAPAHIMPGELEELQRRPRIPELPPAWAAKVPALQSTVKIPDRDGAIATEDEASPEMQSKNIRAFQPHILFV